MKAFFKKARAKVEKAVDDLQQGRRPGQHQQAHHHHPNPPGEPSYHPGQQHFPGMSHDEASTIQEPTALDILRYRYHHGTNLGSIYVIERWLQPSRFPEGADGSSELAAVTAWVDRIGIDATKEKFEKAWADALSDADIEWLVNVAKCTTIRLPIGYYDLPGLTQATPFEPYAQVYSAAWHSIRTLISRLRAHSIGVLIDLHALPGGANGGEHSGTNSKFAGLWGSRENRDLGVRCCKFLAEEATAGLDIAGIQIVNEADWESERMYDWYDDCISAISAIDSSIPVVISDAWNLNKAIQYCLQKNCAHPPQPISPVVIDTHYYWAFTNEDKQKSPQQIISEVWSKLSELDGKHGSVIDRGAVQAIVGEYSCVLTEDSWAKSGDETRSELVKKFGEAQSRRYQHRTGGAYFWTYKMDWLPGGEWGFVCQSSEETRSLVPPAGSQIPQHDIGGILHRANERRDERMWDAVRQHVAYWDHLSPNMPSEHWRYENGWKLGYQDAYAFFEGRGTQCVGQTNRIGNVELWVLKRLRESGFRGNFVWEFEQGVRRGIEDFNAIAGI